MSNKQLFVKGAKEHNLKNIDIALPRDAFIVITGLSGSGKSSLAFDTIYAEGQRRYVESLSAYARQFLGQMEKPNVEYIEGLSPAISIDQKTTSRNPRSTVGTVTEVYDYLRLLFARIGVPHCHICGREISQQSVDQIVDQIMNLPERTKFQVLSPIVQTKKGAHKGLMESLKKEGFVRLRVDGIIYDIAEVPSLDKNLRHDIDIVVDRLVVKEGIGKRLTDSVEIALNHGDGNLLINIIDGEDLKFNTNFACPEHGVTITEMEPRIFSFNNPYGACGNCKGLGHHLRVDPELIVPNPKLSIDEGAIDPYANSQEGTFYAQMIRAICEVHDCDTSAPYRDLPDAVKEAIMFGTEEELTFDFDSKYSGHTSHSASFEGIVKNFERRYHGTNSDYIRKKIEGYMSLVPCESCQGKRLKDEILAITIGGKNIIEITEMSIKDAQAFFQGLVLSERDAFIAEQVYKEIRGRLRFLTNVGLDYLTMARNAGTLSGGESQRIRLATQIGSGLVGVLYILDEPSIGLHQKDNNMLLATLRELTDIGNTLIVVEHDEDTIRRADHVVDIGPGAGEHGGQIIAQGSFEEILKVEDSITAQYLSGRRSVPVPEWRPVTEETHHLEVVGARENNLKQVNVRFPLGVFSAVTGVSGSGKSSLVNEILYKAAAQKIQRSKDKPGKHDEILGLEYIDKVIDIDQSPIGRTPRSNPATYTGVFDDIRDLFARTKEAKARGYKKGRFSFNVKGGRCEHCRGDGMIKIEMHFLPDVYVQCDVCKGKRYNRETLEVKYKGKRISDVLEMTVEEALAFFEAIPKIQRKLQTLHDVGLDYIRLGQPSTQLSGGEAQRIKLATELSKRSTGSTLYILDEPTTGLHIADVHNLINVLQRLVEGGNSVIVIEHNLDVIKCADHIIDLGPEGGDDGGTVVCTGTPAQVAGVKGSYTGQYLKKILT